MYHINDRGEPGLCRATRSCPFGSSSMHYPSEESARHAYEAGQQSFSGRALRLSRGQWVAPGEVAVSSFLSEVIERRGNDRFDGTLEEVALLAQANLHLAEPGVGSIDNDVVLVPVDPSRFRTDIVEITAANYHLLEEVTEARVEGEAPVTKCVLRGLRPQPAEVVKLVLYRADTLARDDNRSSLAEYELVAMLAQPCDSVPMHPTTMARNERHEEGGTKRSYSKEEWEAAEDFWSRHAYAVP